MNVTFGVGLGEPEFGVGVNTGRVDVNTGAIVGVLELIAPPSIVAVGVTNSPPGIPLVGGSVIPVGVGVLVKERIVGVSIGVPVGVGVSTPVPIIVGTAVIPGIMGVAVGVAVGVGVSDPNPSIIGVAVCVDVGVGVSNPIAIIIGASGGPPPNGRDNVSESLYESVFVDVTSAVLTFSPSTQPGGNGFGTSTDPNRIAAPPSAISPISPDGLLPQVKQAPRVSEMVTLKAVPGPRLNMVIEKPTESPGRAEPVLKSLEICNTGRVMLIVTVELEPTSEAP